MAARLYPCRECGRSLRDYVFEKLDEEQVVYYGSEGGESLQPWMVCVRCDCGADNEFNGENLPE